MQDGIYFRGGENTNRSNLCHTSTFRPVRDPAFDDEPGSADFSDPAREGQTRGNQGFAPDGALHLLLFAFMFYCSIATSPPIPLEEPSHPMNQGRIAALQLSSAFMSQDPTAYSITWKGSGCCQSFRPAIKFEFATGRVVPYSSTSTISPRSAFAAAMILS